MDSSAPTDEAQTTQLSIVGIGASAGGLESIERLFRALPTSPGLAFVVIQHLSPDFKSLMDELLARYTDLTVRRAQQGEPVLSDHVYLLPPGKELEIQDGRLWLFERPGTGLNLPIDRFFTSLADDAGDRAVVVILSGTGSDGSRGAKRVHERGGVVLVEDPDSARFDGMPNAAIEADVADLVMPPEGIATALAGRAFKHTADDREPSDHLGEIFGLLRAAFGIDFSQYKVSTVLRRIQRRVDLRKLDTLRTYVVRLRQDPDELSALGHDLLIGVTQFFRDPEAWSALAERVIPRIVAQADATRGVRAWVTGCATGEEAYSLAMLLHEEIAKSRPGLAVKVFASDVHRGALDRAGQGIYSGEALQLMPVGLRERYFTERSDGALQVVQSLRHSVVFAHHNILRSAPFTNLDLATCRNLLIYFRPQAQEYVLSMLSYGMHVGGVLVLGSSESIGSVQDFEPLVEAQHIYQKVRSTRRVPLLPALRQPSVAPPERSMSLRREQRLLGYYDAVLDQVMPPAFLLDGQRELLTCFGGAERLLLMRKRRPTQDFIELVPEQARLPLAGALARAAQRSQTVRFHAPPWGDQHETFDLEISAVATADRSQGYLVRLHSAQQAERGETAPEPALAVGDFTRERVKDLELQLEQARENLQASVEELETSNEEMQATNEELVAANEELQSSNEELQSVNEELHTVNVEHQAKIREVSDINGDMRQLLESIGEAVVLLDEQLCIRRYTTLASTLFNLLPHDLGRPLTNFRHPLHYPELKRDIEACRRTQETYEKYVSAADGGYYLVRISAYQGGAERRAGVVLTIRDLSALRDAQKQIELLSSIVASSRDAVMALDPQRRIVVWNNAAAELYGYTAAEVMGVAFDLIVPVEQRAELDAIFSAAGSSPPRESVRLPKSGEAIEVSSTCSPMYDASGRIVAYSVIERDIRESKLRERQLAERERMFADLFHHSPDLLISTDVRTGILVEVNETFLSCLGYSAEEASKLHFTQLYAPQSRIRASQSMELFRSTGELRDVELVMMRKDGSTFEVSLSSTGLRDAQGRVERSRTVVRDVSERKRAERQMSAAAQMRERFMAMVSHELRTPMHAIRSASEVLSDHSTDASQRAQALRIVQRQSGQMNRLLDDLLDVARITSDKLELSRIPLDLRDAVGDAVQAVRSRYHERGVNLRWQAPATPLPILGDPARLQQVFANLLNNSLRHTEQGGNVELSVLCEPDKCAITVRDDGDGIEAEQLSNIFELFAQAPQSIAREMRGLGLGLSISQRIITAHAGRIVAHSAGKGQGASFTVNLPIDATLSLREERPLTREHLSIVLVEDQDDSREMLQLVLEKRGHNVESAADGPEGLEAILRVRPDVALVDIGLPGMDGYELAEAVRERLAGTVKLVALTGYGQPADLARSRHAGFDRHVTKPLPSDKLELILRELTETQA